MHHVMRFNATLSVDFAQWKNVKMERENSQRENGRQMEEEMPKFGAGSEYHRDLKEELRRKKFGFQPRKFKQGKKKLHVYNFASRLCDRLKTFFFSLSLSNRGTTLDIESWWEIKQKIPWHS